MSKYHRFKKGELVWCTLYPGVYKVVNVQNRELEKDRPYSDLLTLNLEYSVRGNHSPTERLDELHCEKLDVGIKQQIEHLEGVINKLKQYLN